MSNQATQAPLWWEAAPPTLPAQPLPRQAVDVAVVGAGITGLTTALLLRQRGLSVAVVDMQGVGHGDTGRSSAHLTALLDTPYHTLIERFGQEGATAVAHSQLQAIDSMEHLALQHGIDCQWARVPATLYSDVPESDSLVRDELAACSLLGMATRAVHDVPLPFPVRAAMRLERQAQLQPMAYLQGLASAFERQGGTLCGDVRVLGVDDGAPCVVHTTEGELHATQVVMATHSPVSRFNLHTKIYAYRTYVVAARVHALPPPGLYFDARSPYHYLRSAGAAGGDVLLLGGADHKTGQEGDTEARFDQLRDYLGERFSVHEILQQWSGQVLESADGLPFIGPNGSDDHVWVATGYAGNGLTSGTLAATLLADTLTEQPNPYAELYSSRRLKPLAQLRRMMRENIDVPVHLVGDRFVADDITMAQLPPGSGAVVRHDGQALAVYRDDTGQLHTLSPACTHMGCFVKWNGAEQSWDCPCHGSRFSACGKLLQGPAVDDLPRLELIETERDEPGLQVRSFEDLFSEPKLS